MASAMTDGEGTGTVIADGSQALIEPARAATTYRDAGVDIDAATAAVDRLKSHAHATFATARRTPRRLVTSVGSTGSTLVRIGFLSPVPTGSGRSSNSRLSSVARRTRESGQISSTTVSTISWRAGRDRSSFSTTWRWDSSMGRFWSRWSAEWREPVARTEWR